MNEPMISILIPAYNHQNYIKQTLDSILNDSYKRKEIVIIDDGSPDNTEEVIKNWINNNKNKIKIIFKRRDNLGLTKTLNELISMSSGEYITFLASDDYLLDGGLEKRYAYLQSYPQKCAVFSDSITINKDGIKIYDSTIFGCYASRKSNKNLFMTDPGIKHQFIKNFVVPGSVLMVNRNCLEIHSVYFNESLQIEDFDFYLKLASKNLIGYLDEKVSAHRILHHQHETNLTTSIGLIKTLQDYKKTLLSNLSNFHGKDTILILYVVAKFEIRIRLEQFKNCKYLQK